MVLVVGLGLRAGGAAAQEAKVQERPPAPAVAPVPALPQPFPEWLAELHKEAVARGIPEALAATALDGIEPLPVVIERDRTQAERTLPVDKYLKRRLDRKTIRTAREMRKSHADVLEAVSQKYGVPPGLLVSVWGLESAFGRFSGVRPTITALATLAYDNRRAAMFREELFAALQILARGDIDLEHMRGSWAGAMGQPQFMPSSYLKFAVDFDGDGKADIWRSLPDVFGSIGNFMATHGWTRGHGWGRAVKMPSRQADREKVEAAAPLRTEGCEAVRQMTEPLPLSKWRALGVKPTGNAPLPPGATPASLVRAGDRSFLVFDNYSALLQYNCAHAYALSVALLSEQAGAGGTAQKPSKTKGGKAKKGKK